MAYATVGLVTDYDCRLDYPAQHVSVGAIFERYGQTLRTECFAWCLVDMDADSSP